MSFTKGRDLLILMLVVVSVDADNSFLQMEELCKSQGKRIYLEFGDHGTLSGSVGFPKLPEKSPKEVDKTCVQCSLEIVTCPFCTINLKFNFSSLTGTCRSNSTSSVYCGECVHLYEMSYKATSDKHFCGCPMDLEGHNYVLSQYTSKTRSLSLTFSYSVYSERIFAMEYSTQSAITDIENKHQEDQNNVVSTPFFPAFYPPDFCVEYVIKCNSSLNCTVLVTFTDFQISHSSVVEFFDWDGQRLYLTTGQCFRPPIIFSSGPNMVIRFTANGESNLGFRAVYSFYLNGPTRTELPATDDCGGLADNLGGAITMMEILDVKLYDCFWIIRPQKHYIGWKTGLYLSVAAFANFDNTTELRIHEGVTSAEDPIEIIKQADLNETSFAERRHVVSIEKGFYISLKGLFRPASKLVIVYSAFSYKDCFAGANFLCHNRRCISILLHCDGFDNCGDNSDEPVSCFRNNGRFHHSLVPNFYFPTINHYYDFKTAAFIFIICSLGTTCLIFGVIILLYRINLQNNNRRTFQGHIETINAILEDGINREAIEEEIVISDEPPDYEDPPQYTDVMAKAFSLKQNNSADNNKSIGNQIMKSGHSNLFSCTSSATCSSTGFYEGEHGSQVALSINKSSSLPPHSPPPAYTTFNKLCWNVNICGSYEEFLSNSWNTNDISKWLLDVHQISSPLGINRQRTEPNMFLGYKKSSHRLILSYSEGDLDSVSKSAMLSFEIENSRSENVKRCRSMCSERFLHTV